MRRLYVRIYFAVLASLAVFALAAGLLWRAFGMDGPWNQAYEVAATLAQNALPPASAPKTEQQAALEKLAANLRADVALFAPNGSPLAAVGEPLPAPETSRERGGWIHRWGEPAFAARLPDGRWLEMRAPHGHRHTPYGLFLVLALLALAVGVGAYPVARRLTSRLERLQAGVESLGAGELRIRMAVELMKERADPVRKAGLEQDIAELDALIDEILLASRLDALERLEANEDVDLLALAAEECARYDDTQLDGQPVTVRGDPRLLRRMIRNLLENAKRHGIPPIEVRVSRTGDDAQMAVCDYGAGVPEAERERVFDPFYRRTGTKDIARAGGAPALSWPCRQILAVDWTLLQQEI